jgi:hypothetical protein
MKIKLSLVVAGLLTTSLSASSIINDDIVSTSVGSEIKVENQKLDKLEKRVLKLEKIIKSQQKYIKDLESNSEDIEDIDERLEVVETRSFTDKISMGIGMRVEMNNYSNTYVSGKTFSANDIWRTRLNINMKSRIADNLKFTGRLSMYKNWGDSTQRMTENDSMQGRRPDGSQLYAERAYLDWVINPKSQVPVVLTIGRQPSSDGPSYHIKEDSTRKGTYDALAFDGAADGIVFTANLNKIIPGTAFRVAYGTPNVQDNAAGTMTQQNYNGYDDEGNFNDTKVTGYFIDKTFKSLSFNNLTQAYVVSAKDLNANPNYDTNTTLPGKEDINVGDITISGAMFEAQKIGGKFDFFAHYAKSVAKPNGKAIMIGQDSTGNYIYGSLLSGYSMNPNTGAKTGYVDDKKEKSGSAYWIGARYAITKSVKLGAEYNKGSQYWYSFTSGSNDPLNKLATRGSVVEGYFSVDLNKHANIRVGYQTIKYDYTGSGSHLGAPTAIDEIPAACKDQAIKEASNTYLTFNLLF